MFYSFLRQQSVKDSAFLYVSSYISYALAFILTIVLAKGLGIENYGVIVLLISVTEFTRSFFSLKTNEASVKFLSAYIDKEKGKALSIIKISYLLDLVLGAFVAAILFFMAGIIGEVIFHNEQVGYFLKFFALMPLIDSVQSSSNAIFQVFKKFDYFGSMMVISRLLRLLGAIFFISAGLKGIVFAFIGAGCMASFAYVVAALMLVYRNFRNVKIKYSLEFIRSFLHFNLHVYLSTTFKALNSKLDILLLGYFRTAAEVSYYKIALSIAGILTMIYEPLVANIYPRIARLWNEGKKLEIKKLIIKSSLFTSTITILATLGLVFFIRPIIKTFFGQEYDPAYLAVYIIIGGSVYTSFVFWARSFILGIGKPNISTALAFSSAAFVAVSGLFLIPRYGYIGASITSLLNLCVFNTVLIIIFNKFISSNRGSFMGPVPLRRR